MIKISRSNTNWLSKGEENVSFEEAKERLMVLAGGLDDPRLLRVLHFNVYIERGKITFTAMIKRPHDGWVHTRFEGSVSEIQELAKLLPRSEKKSARD